MLQVMLPNNYAASGIITLYHCCCNPVVIYCHCHAAVKECRCTIFSDLLCMHAMAFSMIWKSLQEACIAACCEASCYHSKVLTWMLMFLGEWNLHVESAWLHG